MAGPLRITIVHAAPSGYWSLPLDLAAGAIVADALAKARGDARFDAAWPGVAGLAICGRSVGEEAALHEGDRIELLRPLQADPKQARRERASPVKRRG